MVGMYIIYYLIARGFVSELCIDVNLDCTVDS